MITVTDVGWEPLRDMWEAEKRPGYVIRGSVHYQVFTPDGPEFPIFHPMGADIQMYTATSTGVAKAEPVVTKAKKASSKGGK